MGYQDMDVPLCGSEPPHSGNRITRAIGRLLLALFRWHIEGEVLDRAKFVMVVAPHTSIYDFFTGLATKLTLGCRSQWLVADRYTWWPLGSILRSFGAMPVDRSAHHDLVSKMIQRFNQEDKFILTIFPEGTRRRVEKWKTGFWHIASGADVPIQIVGIDYEKRATIFGPALDPSGNLEADMKEIQAWYRGVKAKHPDQFFGEYV